MLQIKTTPNLYGISLQGDYSDLNDLYDSISRYLAFYMEVNKGTWPYHEYEYLLSLNYDIRHAFMGGRETLSVNNNAEAVGVHAENIWQIPDDIAEEIRNTRKKYRDGNLYFSVNILYPLVFHYLIAFSTILEDEINEDIFSDPGADYSEPWMREYTFIDAKNDSSRIILFVSVVWKNIQEMLGPANTAPICRYLTESDFFVPSSLYCDALLHCQDIYFKNRGKEKKLLFLELTLYEMIGPEDLASFPSDYQNALRR